MMDNKVHKDRKKNKVTISFLNNSLTLIILIVFSIKNKKYIINFFDFETKFKDFNKKSILLQFY